MKMMNWGWCGPTSSFTSNREYGKGVLMAMQQQQQNSIPIGTNNGTTNFTGGWNPNTIGMNTQVLGSGGSTYPAFTPGHAHSPTCPNYGAGMNQSYNYGKGQIHSPNCPNHGQVEQIVGTTGGVYSTGGNSSTDFTVYVGDAATAAMGQNGQDQGQEYKVNYSIPSQPNVTEGGSAMNYQQSSGPAGDQGQNQIKPQQELVVVSGQPQWNNGDGIMPQGEGGVKNSDNMLRINRTTRSKTQPIKLKSLQPNMNMSITDMTGAISTSSMTKNLGNKYKNRQHLGRGSGSGSNDSIPHQQQHVYSSLRGGNRLESKPSFQLCGRCTKCKNLKDPISTQPSIVNFNIQGLTPNGTKGLSNPSSTIKIKPQATPSLCTPMPMTGNNISNMNFPSINNNVNNSSTPIPMS